MALVVQNDDGTQVGANGYITLVFYRAYWLDRGIDLSAIPDATLEAGIIQATGYLDTRHRYIGQRKNFAQTTQWPRINVFNRDNRAVFGIPSAVQFATAEYARRAQAATLMPDPTQPASGRRLRSFSETIGPIARTQNYGDRVAAYDMPHYPYADQLLRVEGFIVRGMHSARA
jgi:hypothetical protein